APPRTTTLRLAMASPPQKEERGTSRAAHSSALGRETANPTSDPQTTPWSTLRYQGFQSSHHQSEPSTPATLAPATSAIRGRTARAPLSQRYSSPETDPKYRSGAHNAARRESAFTNGQTRALGSDLWKAETSRGIQDR